MAGICQVQPSLSGFLEHDSQDRVKHERHAEQVQKAPSASESKEVPGAQQTQFYHPTPSDFADEPLRPEAAPDFLGRSDQLIEKRKDYERQKNAADTAQAALEEEQSVLHRWYREPQSTAERPPMIGPAIAAPGFPSFYEREHLLDRPPEPRESVVIPVGDGLDDFLRRDRTTLANQQGLGSTSESSSSSSTQVFYTTPRSREIISSRSDRQSVRTDSAPVYTYRPDTRLTNSSSSSCAPRRLSLECVETQMILRDLKRLASIREEEEPLGKPRLGNRKKREAMTVKSRSRYDARKIAADPKVAFDEDLQKMGEQNRKERKKRGKARKKITMGFEYRRPNAAEIGAAMSNPR
jgi:hypothetical protein